MPITPHCPIRSSLCALLIAILVLTGCHPCSQTLQPNVGYCVSEGFIRKLPSPFPEFTEREEWAKEARIAEKFARELDLYRAITGYKRALFLLEEEDPVRKQQLEFHIVECYYLGGKYCDVIEHFEESSLTRVTGEFPALRELLIIVNDSYERMGYDERAEQIIRFIEKGNEETAQDLQLSHAIRQGRLCDIPCYAQGRPSEEDVDLFLHCYALRSKSVSRAQTLNAILPGAGYYYVGQKRSALTSFLLNASFIYATAWFFDKGNIGAGVVTASLEAGWYIGGINGAGLAAKQYNETLYNCSAQELMIRNKLFPVLMWETAF